MSCGQKETWKVVYTPIEITTTANGGRRGVALVEAADRHEAMFNFREQYQGQYFTVESCEKLF